MKNSVTTTIGLLIGIAIPFFWIKGIIHSYKVHSKIDFAISFTPPWGVIRGIESFWHKNNFENSGLSQKDETLIVLHLLTVMPSSIEEEKGVDSLVRIVSSRIKNDKPERREYVKSASNMYVRFHKEFTQEMLITIAAISEDPESFNALGWGKKSKAILDSLIYLYDLKGVMEEYEANRMDMINIRNGIKKNGINQNEKSSMLSEFSKVAISDRLRISNMYKKIFGESPPIEGY